MVEKGLCACGCGGKTGLVKQTINSKGIKKGDHNKYICGHSQKGKFQKENPSWKGGRYINHSGYVMVSIPGHKRSQQNGYVREHIYIAEKVLGKELPEKAQVHHFGSPSDNSQLVICEDQKYHFLLHIRAKALKECGDANKRKCKFCKKYDFIENLYCVQSNHGHGWNVYHDNCLKIYENKRYHGKRKKNSNT